MLAICVHLMKGTPYVYQGDELGMVNPGYDSIERFRDVETTNYYQIMLEMGKGPEEALRVVSERSRDNGRTPMQWSARPGAGFTEGSPWLEIPASHKLVNAEAEVGVAGSMFEHYRALIRLRHELDAIARGSVRFLDAGPAAPKVIAYERTLGERRVVVACSFDAEPCSIADLGVSGAAVLHWLLRRRAACGRAASVRGGCLDHVAGRERLRTWTRARWRMRLAGPPLWQLPSFSSSTVRAHAIGRRVPAPCAVTSFPIALPRDPALRRTAHFTVEA